MIVKEKYKGKVIGGAMVRTINVNEITKNIKEMCIEANHYLSPDMETGGANRKISTWKTNLRAVTGKPKNSSRGHDSDLSGYRNGSYIFRNWSGCTF